MTTIIPQIDRGGEYAPRFMDGQLVVINHHASSLEGRECTVVMSRSTGMMDNGNWNNRTKIWISLVPNGGTGTISHWKLNSLVEGLCSMCSSVCQKDNLETCPFFRRRTS